MGIETLPSHLVLPVPSMTRSRAWSTWPLRASTTTALMTGIAPRWPVTVVCQPRRERGAVLPDHQVGRVSPAVAWGTWWRAVRDGRGPG